MFKRALLILTLLITPVAATLSASNVSAVDVFDNNVCERFSGEKDTAKIPVVCQDKKVGNDNPIFGPNGILIRIINLLSAVVAVIAIIIILLAGLKFITSGNNPQDVSNARERVIYAVVAIIVASLAQVFVRFIIDKIG